MKSIQSFISTYIHKQNKIKVYQTPITPHHYNSPLPNKPPVAGAAPNAGAGAG